MHDSRTKGCIEREWSERQRKIHTGEKPFVSTNYDEKFVRRRGLMYFVNYSLVKNQLSVLIVIKMIMFYLCRPSVRAHDLLGPVA